MKRKAPNARASALQMQREANLQAQDREGSYRLPDGVEVIHARSLFNPAVFDELVAKCDREIAFVRDSTLDNDDDEAFAAERLVNAKRLEKAIKARYDQDARPHLDALDKLRKLVKPYTNKATGLLAAYTSLLGEYAIVKAERRAAALENAREAAADRDSEGVTEALNVVKDSEQSKLAGVSIKVGWYVGGVDMSKLPEEYVLRSPDLKALAELAAGVPEDQEPPAVAGVVWSLGTSQRVRT